MVQPSQDIVLRPTERIRILQGAVEALEAAGKTDDCGNLVSLPRGYTVIRTSKGYIVTQEVRQKTPGSTSGRFEWSVSSDGRSISFQACTEPYTWGGDVVHTPRRPVSVLDTFLKQLDQHLASRDVSERRLTPLEFY